MDRFEPSQEGANRCGLSAPLAFLADRPLALAVCVPQPRYLAHDLDRGPLLVRAVLHPHRRVQQPSHRCRSYAGQPIRHHHVVVRPAPAQQHRYRRRRRARRPIAARPSTPAEAGSGTVAVPLIVMLSKSTELPAAGLYV